MRICALLITLLTVFPAMSQWKLDNNNSTVSFLTIKKQHIAENHHFTVLSGTIAAQGEVNLSIDLTSVNTKIAIRDDRMKEHLFNTNVFSHAKFNAQLSSKELSSIEVGTSKRLSVTGKISLHGQQQEFTASVMVVMLSDKNMLVTSLEPLLIKAQDFDLVTGINKLQKLANLPSIGYTVPVSFVLSFVNH